MATITEDYVSFETAKLLKEKGFDAKCRYYYIQTGEMFELDTRFHSVLTTQELLNIQIGEEKEERCVVPTLQMAMKWLREVHNIFICVLFLEESNEFGYTIENIITKKYITTSKNSSYKEPEEAGEVAIKYCLEHLIK